MSSLPLWALLLLSLIPIVLPWVILYLIGRIGNMDPEKHPRLVRIITVIETNKTLHGIFIALGIILIIVLFVLLFPHAPFSEEEYDELSRTQFIQLVEHFEARAARFRALFIITAGAFALYVATSRHEKITAEQRENDLQKELDKKNERYQRSETLWQTGQNKYEEKIATLNDEIASLKQQLKTEGIDNSDLYNEIDELQYQVKKLQADVDFYKYELETEYGINCELEEKIKKKDAFIQELTQKLTE